VRLRLKLIGCEILYRELCALVARSPNQVDLEFLPKGLHDIGSTRMRSRLQETVDAVDPEKYQAVLLGYALCGNGLAGVVARKLPLVLPRAHDCIALFMGSKERYLEYFNRNSGVYFRTTGWLERAEKLDQLSVQTQNYMGADYQKLVEKYGEDNAQYLYEELGRQLSHYSRLTFIQMGVEPDDSFERRSREEAAGRGWEFEKIAGDLSLLQALVDGDWDDERFLVVKPGQRVVARYDSCIIAAEDSADDRP
jgi:Protein of unknown function (DUF1638)